MWRKVSAAPARRHHHAGELRQLRQQLRGGLDHALRVVGVQLALELVQLARLERLDHQQRVDEEAVAARRRHAAGGGVRARDEAQLLEVGHHVADRGGRQIEPGVLRQRARADRLAVGDVALDQASSAGSGRACRAWNSLYTRRACPRARSEVRPRSLLIGKLRSPEIEASLRETREFLAQARLRGPRSEGETRRRPRHRGRRRRHHARRRARAGAPRRAAGRHQPGPRSAS